MHTSSTENSTNSLELTRVKKNSCTRGTISSMMSLLSFFLASRYNRNALSSLNTSTLSMKAQHCSSSSVSIGIGAIYIFNIYQVVCLNSKKVKEHSFYRNDKLGCKVVCETEGFGKHKCFDLSVDVLLVSTICSLPSKKLQTILRPH